MKVRRGPCWNQSGYRAEARRPTAAMPLSTTPSGSSNSWDDLGSEGLDAHRLRLGADHLFAVESAVANLQIMTIHKAKGLEFDHVLLPFLDRQTKATEAPLLRWRLQDNRLLMAARESGGLYDWLAEEDRQRERHELQRLLYVGCTRARRTLLLSAVQPEGKPARGSLLHLLRAGAGNANVEKSLRPGHHQTEGKAVAHVQHRLSGRFSMAATNAQAAALCKRCQPIFAPCGERRCAARPYRRAPAGRAGQPGARLPV